MKKKKKRPAKGETLQFQKEVGGECPFCEGDYAAGYVRDQPLVLHTQPPCERYLALEPDDYLREVRIATVGLLPDDAQA